MSGRSAFVRVKNTEQADKRAHRAYSDYGKEDHFVYGYSGAPLSMSRPAISADPSHISSPRPRRRQSISSAGSTYGYPPPSMRKPRPIIVASAIEKSDFRTHLDGMSASLRGKLGRLMKGGDDHTPLGRRRTGPVTVSSDTESRSTDFTPSINAVPSLTASTSPSEGPPTYPSFGPSTSHVIRAKQQQQQESVLHKIRRFEGGGKLPQLGWKSLASNPELWDENGDTFVYMYMRGSRTKPPPSFRINSNVIVQSGSKAFIDKLYNPDEPEGWPRFYPYEPRDSGFVSRGDPSESFTNYAHGMNLNGDDDDIDAICPLDDPRRYTAKAPRGIQHEIYVPWPGAEVGTHSTIWHITTRNFFAVMYDASALVGTTLHEAMFKLFERISIYPDYLESNIGKVDWLTDYLVRHKFDDVRNNPSYAASILAFSERVQWREGYIEAFVHCVGMLNFGLTTVPEWRFISEQTKIFINNANLEFEERIHRAQKWLLSFEFNDMWVATSVAPTPARQCYDRLRKWLCKYYENAFLHWPPTNDQTWLTRDMVLRLKNDFHGLYDYLVDRDVIFDGSEYRADQKWAISSSSGRSFKADSSELPLTDILAGFDTRNHFPHIPHPYPVCPASVPVQMKPKSSFMLKKPSSPSDTTSQSRRKVLSYSEATNVYILRDHTMHTDLVSNFIKFEQQDMIDSYDPYEARRGRWVLIYGILQVLATVSVDSPNLRYKDNVQYHLSPQMKGIVPWSTPGSPPEDEAEHTRSHCWTIPATWGPSIPKARPGAHKPILWGQFGDGRVRGESVEGECVMTPPANRDRVATPPGKSERIVTPPLNRERVMNLTFDRNLSFDRNQFPSPLDRDRVITPSLDRVITPQKSSELSIGRKRAEEWVAGQHMDIRSDAGVSAPPVDTETIMSESPPKARKNSGVTVDRVSGSSGDCSSESAARRRRALIHGFTDFQVPDEW